MIACLVAFPIASFALVNIVTALGCRVHMELKAGQKDKRHVKKGDKRGRPDAS